MVSQWKTALLFDYVNIFINISVTFCKVITIKDSKIVRLLLQQLKMATICCDVVDIAAELIFHLLSKKGHFAHELLMCCSCIWP